MRTENQNREPSENREPENREPRVPLIPLTGRLESINVSNGGVPKQSVFEAWIGAGGVDGDRQRDRRFHGGPDRAVVIFSLDVIRALQREGHPIAIGTAGENLTISGIDWALVAPGAELAIGDVRLHVTKYASPCYKINGSFARADSSRTAQTLHPGWSRVCARVIAEGLVRMADTVELLTP